MGAASSEYGEGDIDVEIGAEPGERRRWATITDHGRGALMRGMGGDLVVDPADPGRGATFHLTLPGEPADEAQARSFDLVHQMLKSRRRPVAGRGSRQQVIRRGRRGPARHAVHLGTPTDALAWRGVRKPIC